MASALDFIESFQKKVVDNKIKNKFNLDDFDNLLDDEKKD